MLTGPVYVVATDWQDALKAWQRYVADEGDDPSEYDPDGIQLIAKDHELIA